MKYILVAAILLTGCLETQEQQSQSQMEQCWKKGGDEFQVGISGASNHVVCVFYKDKE